MKYMFDEEQETESLRSRARTGRKTSEDSEITLGTRSLLAIFFGLVLICGVFFGLGYSVGRGSEARALPDPNPAAAAPTTTARLAKPSAQETLTAVPPAGAADAQAGQDVRRDEGVSQQASQASAEPSTATAPALAGSGSSTSATQPTDRPPSTAFAPVSVAQNQNAAATVRPAAAVVQPVAASSSYVVQIAAVRLPQDASILVNVLRKRGYIAVARNEPQDQLLHVQVGPFANRNAAYAMRAHLLADGYNAVVK